MLQFPCLKVRASVFGGLECVTSGDQGFDQVFVACGAWHSNLQRDPRFHGVLDELPAGLDLVFQEVLALERQLLQKRGE